MSTPLKNHNPGTIKDRGRSLVERITNDNFFGDGREQFGFRPEDSRTEGLLLEFFTTSRLTPAELRIEK